MQYLHTPYILKHSNLNMKECLTREARYKTIQDNKGRSITEHPKLDAMCRYKHLSHKFLNLAYQAVSIL